MDIRVNILYSGYLPGNNTLLLKRGESWEQTTLVFAQYCLHKAGMTDGVLGVFAPYVLEKITNKLKFSPEAAIFQRQFLLNEWDASRITTAAHTLVSLFASEETIRTLEDITQKPFDEWEEAKKFKDRRNTWLNI